MLYKKFKYEPKQKDLDELNTNLNKLDTHFIWYKLNSNIPIHKSIKVTTKIQTDTIDFFLENRENVTKKSIIKNIIDDLGAIKQYDVVFELDGKFYAYHTLRIFLYIYEHLLAYKLSKDLDFLETTVAKYPTTKAFYKQQYEEHRAKAFQIDNMDERKDLMLANIFRHLYHSEKKAKFFINTLSLIPMHQIRFFNENKKITKRVYKLFRYFSSATLTPKQISTSLAITLNYYMRFKMKFNIISDILNDNKNGVINYIVDSCFNLDIGYRSTELLKNIHIANSISFLPIFAVDTKNKNFYAANDKLYIYNSLKESSKELGISMNLPIKYKMHLATNPMFVYSQRMPSEILEKI